MEKKLDIEVTEEKTELTNDKLVLEETEEKTTIETTLNVTTTDEKTN